MTIYEMMLSQHNEEQGTCLRIFHGLPRFSEDLDFSLIEKRDLDIWSNDYFLQLADMIKFV